ncbi:MAG: PhoH family protein, partial [Candidatus Marinimicrobia bacterium]|nr:PhoH family protein [Candidatus Neomarinimicrobiota bacterium]
MADTRREILLRGFDPLALLGVNDENLKVLQDHFQAEIMARGQSIKITGDPIEVERIHHIINQLIQLIPKKEYIKPSDVKTVINIEADASETIYSIPEESIILFTPNGLIRPRTPGQAEYYRIASENDITFVIGPAGTGKTYQAVAMAVAALKNREIRKIILTRPAVEAGENLGFLPGDMKEKIDPYLAPLYDALKTMISPEKLKVFFEQKI